jgi:hypothetical protein
MSAPKHFSQIVLDLYQEGPRLRPTLDAFLEFYSLKSSGVDAGAKNLSQIVVEFYKIPELRQTLKNILHFYGSELNRPLDDGGNTLLHYAYTYRDADMIQFLLYFGANPAIKNYAGKMATERL